MPERQRANLKAFHVARAACGLVFLLSFAYTRDLNTAAISLAIFSAVLGVAELIRYLRRRSH